LKLNVRAADPEEYSDIYDLVDAAFKSRLERRMIRITVSDDPHFQKGDLRVTSVDGKVLSMMMLLRRPLRVGTAVVNGAIVAPLATHPDYQGKGYCSAVMRDAVQYMKAQGFDITILWGNPWLYPHYGYSPSMVRTELVVKSTQKTADVKNPFRVRPFVSTDVETITRIYNNNTATRTCAEVRSPATWEWKPNGSEVELEVVTDAEGEVIGYWSLGTDWGRPCAHEVGVLNDEACGVIFNCLLETSKTKGVTEFYCIIHPDHPFARFAFRHGSEVRIRSGGGAGMARVLNPVSLLTAMEKELERRLHHSELHDLGGTLTIVGEESAVLHFDNGRVSMDAETVEGGFQLDISLPSFNPLITGYLDINELAKRPHVMVTGGKQAVRLIDVLFPAGFPSGGFLPLVWE
jgi:predicted N-acetyltransferase YhbS